MDTNAIKTVGVRTAKMFNSDKQTKIKVNIGLFIDMGTENFKMNIKSSSILVK